MFRLVDENTILSTINRLKNKSSHGFDNISNILIKKAKHVLVKPPTLLINQTLTTGEFPNELKISKVKPLLKQGIHYKLITIDLFLCYLQFQKFMNILYSTNCSTIWKPINFLVYNSLDFEEATQLN